MNIDEKYLFRCIELGKKGLGTTAPNPMVGCVIVHNDKIIGEGFTSPFGGPHAEVNAINSVKNKLLLPQATLYVTLEPCSHYGKTPPCADYIIKHAIPKIVIGLKDPHTKVAGKGIERLRASSCDVKVGVLSKECRELHKRFLTFQEKKRPYIILKWAETLNGFIAPEPSKRGENPKPFWITNTYSRQLVHQWRSEEQAILVGTNTVLLDNPKLDVRDWAGTNPMRVVLDARLRIPQNFHVMDESVDTLVLHDSKINGNHKRGIRYLAIDYTSRIAPQICQVLYEHQITSVLIEGGKQTLESFITANLWDEARIFTGASSFKNGTSAPKISGRVDSTKTIIQDTLTVLKND
ncbi:bifunctional diaminohydroxyphosphoribosylaminopyrimidine deaminase/5-amino-6-(5-phosphoribosylamino)uracil reductase RibD [Croceitalea sp. MTPC5]|uniref:bifunctional diaminohydroxyphosphoribosylaminopyrimidine deaminase/5-amino-6-(5-phosphoribosylamino)uracil reductase RibD n=1 Tax=Croceitalea sp. MTPC5 TaxID=3056565 RepID=UPI002B382CA9|nr:bifunctional diaminohydroxyphosphoribosylaminopyrimidine deaminase/5-amino-6-(5-phosphoribosylamino)uracil reductase RibD [Croceitalea sp. MTPC5]